MFQVLYLMQIVGIIVLLYEIFYMIPKIACKGHVFMFLFVIEALIDCLGYLLEISSDVKAVAFAGTKVCYVGRTYLLLTILEYVLDFCKMKMPRALEVILFTFQTIILGLVLFAESTPLYYTSIEMVESGLYPHLVFGHGIMYTVYQIVYALQFIAMFVILTGKIITSKTKREKQQTIMLLSMLAVSALSIVLYAFELTGGFDILGLAQTISAVILLFGIFKLDMLSTVDAVKNNLVDNLEMGIVILDDSNNVIYCNNIVSKLYPNIISKPEEIISEMERCCRTEDKIFNGERVYMVRREKSEDKSSKVYVIPNITNTYNYMERLEREIDKRMKEMEQ